METLRGHESETLLYCTVFGHLIFGDPIQDGTNTYYVYLFGRLVGKFDSLIDVHNYYGRL